MRVNLFETTLDGHRTRYLKEILIGLNQNNEGFDLRLCIFDRDRNNSEYKEFLSPIENMFRVCPLPFREFKGAFRSEFTRLKLLKHCLQEYPCDRLIVPYGDGLVPLMGITPRWVLRKIVPEGVEMESMLFRPAWVYDSGGWISRIYQRIRLCAVERWPGAQLHFSDRNAWDRAVRGQDRFEARVSLVPEVFEDWSLVAREHGLHWLQNHEYLPSGSEKLDWSNCVVSLPGVPSLRKGAAELIEAFVRLRELPCILLLWGAIPKTVEERLIRKGVSWESDPRIVLVSKYVDDDAFRALFSLVDSIALPYQYNLGGVSSIYLLSVIHRKRTLCDARAWLGWAAKRYQHGYLVDSRRQDEIQRGLKSLVTAEKLPVASYATAEELKAECAQEHFRSKWGVA